MNKTLFEKVKAKCKDTGLSEKYLKTITEKIGGSIEDDSTDETAIDAMANQIVDVCVETQGEATRWASKKKDPKDPKDPADLKDPVDPKNSNDPADASDARIKALEDKISELEKVKASNDRTKSIEDGLSTHGLTKSEFANEYREYLAVCADKDVNEYLTAKKQMEIVKNLMPADAEGVKAVSEKAVGEAATSLLESITAK